MSKDMELQIEQFIKNLERKLASFLVEKSVMLLDEEEYSYRFYNEEREEEE